MQERRNRNHPHKRNRDHRPNKIVAPKKPRIALIGFRGVGKSAIARRLQEWWKIPFISLDHKIEVTENKRIDEIVAEQGWPYFREREYEALKACSTEPQLLLDCGGGIVEEADGSRSERKIALLKENFFCIYIYLSEEKMRQRLNASNKTASRPALPNVSDSIDELIKVFKRRESSYLDLAHTMVDISDTNVEESAFRITQLLR